MVAAEDHEVVAGHAAVHVRVVVVRARAVADHAIMRPVLRRCRGHQLRTFAERVVAKLQTVGRRWVICPRREVAQARGPEIGQARATLPIGQTWAPGQVQVLGQALVQGPSLEQDQEPADDRRHAMCKIFLICRMPVVGISAAAARQAALAMLQPPLAARWPAVQRRSF